MSELVDDAVCITKDVAKVNGMIAAGLIFNYFLEFERREFEHEPIVLPLDHVLVGDLRSQVGAFMRVGTGHIDAILDFRPGAVQGVMGPGDPLSSF